MRTWTKIVVVVGCQVSCGCGGSPGENGPDWMAHLGGVKTACESEAKALIEKGIDGHAEYAKAEKESSECIAFLIGCIGDGNAANLGKVQSHLDRLQATSQAFQRWAASQIRKDENGGPTVGANRGPTADLAAVAMAICKRLNEQDMQRRAAVKKDLEKLRFKSWADLAKEKPTGHLT